MSSERISWRAIAATAAGVAHVKAGLPCQDAVAWCSLDLDQETLLLAALADGAGSAEHSELGAQEAVTAGLEALVEALCSPPAPAPVSPFLSGSELDEADVSASSPAAAAEPDALSAEALGAASQVPSESQPEETWALRQGFTEAQHALDRLAVSEGLPLRSLASTLTLLVLRQDRLVVGQLGDGVVVACRADGSLVTVTRPQRGEYANETYFLTQGDALEHVEVAALDEAVTGLAMMSDGLLRLALSLPAGEPHAPFFQPLFAFARGASDPDAAVQQLTAFLDSPRLNARTDDDKSLLLVTRGEQA